MALSLGWKIAIGALAAGTVGGGAYYVYKKKAANSPLSNSQVLENQNQASAAADVHKNTMQFSPGVAVVAPKQPVLTLSVQAGSDDTYPTPAAGTQVAVSAPEGAHNVTHSYSGSVSNTVDDSTIYGGGADFLSNGASGGSVKLAWDVFDASLQETVSESGTVHFG